MPASHPQPATGPRALERYFEVALYLMMLTGFGTLAQTGQVDPVTVLLVIGALVARGYLLVRRHSFVLSERWTQYLTLGFTVWYLVDFWSISGSFLPATVHLVLALMVVRLFSARRDRDYVFLSILSFLLVLAASVLTVSSTFLVTFSCFMLTAVATFILLEMRRAAVAASVQARELPQGPASQSIGVMLSATSTGLVVAILVVAVAIFFLLPRISAGYLSAYAPGGQLSAGFSDRVELGRIGEIQQSDSVVMHVQIEGDKRGSFDLKWRGVALSIFDGRNWSSAQKQVIVPRLPDGRYVFREADAEDLSAWRESPFHRTHPIHYRVLLEPLGTNVFFLAPRPLTLQGNYQMVTTDDGGAVYDLDRDRPPGLYEADSDVTQPNPQELRKASRKRPQEFDQYLQVPELDPRIAELARNVTEAADNNYDKAVALEHYLSTSYGYTLQLGSAAPKDPLASFLFERKRGHCEYFASAMAMMLRTLDIPSRIVNGFRTGEFNDVNSQYVVRERNAHSWVEAFFPGYGWVSFDPTPADPLQTRRGASRFVLYFDAMASFWREWIVNYDLGHQRTLGQQATHSSRALAERIREWGRRHYRTMLRSARRTRHTLIQSPAAWSAGAIGAVLALILLSNARRIWAAVQLRRIATRPEKDPRLAATVWYERMTRKLARRGWRKSPVQTPSEFVATIQDAGVRRSVAEFTQHYENARFGESAEGARRLEEIYEEISQTQD